MKDKFIKFVRNNPSLIDYVKNNNASWQDLYEIYALYGEDKNIWSKYLNNNYKLMEDLIKMIKKVNLENVKKTTESLEKAIEILQGLSSNKNSNEEPRRYGDLSD